MPQNEVVGYPWAKMAKGKCVGCEKEMTWKPLAKHVAGCKKLAAAADAAPAAGAAAADGGNANAYANANKVVTIAFASKPFFLVLRARGDATLEEVHDLVKRTWFEGECLHIAHFRLPGNLHRSVLGWEGTTPAKGTRVASLVEGMGLYEFDQQPHTVLVGPVTEVPPGGKLPTAKVAIAARNVWPGDFYVCRSKGCPHPAKYWEPNWAWCDPCLLRRVGLEAWPEGMAWPSLGEYEDTRTGEELYLHRLYNSPRTGACGFDGSDADWEGRARPPPRAEEEEAWEEEEEGGEGEFSASRAMFQAFMAQTRGQGRGEVRSASDMALADLMEQPAGKRARGDEQGVEEEEEEEEEEQRRECRARRRGVGRRRSAG